MRTDEPSPGTAGGTESEGVADRRRVVVVVVTYGRRLALLRRTVAALDGAGPVARIVIVDNGSDEPVTVDALASLHPLDIVRLNSNVGSAGGFARGIEAALQVKDAHYLAIVDDDNVGDAGFLRTLIDLHDEKGGADEIALAALRSDRPHHRRLLDRPQSPQLQANAFLGFHVRDLPARIWRRLAKRGGAATAAAVRTRRISVAPYGGLFITLAAARRVGLPRADFVLYGDDHEYTRRFADHGIALFLTDLATIRDIDQSWNLAPKQGSPWLNADGPTWRIYYAARNHIYLERTEKGTSRIVHSVNGLVFTGRLFVEALAREKSFSGAMRALAPFRAALADARRGALGKHPQFRLPGENRTDA